MAEFAFAVGFVFVSATRGLLGDDDVKKLSRVRFILPDELLDENVK